MFSLLLNQQNDINLLSEWVRKDNINRVLIKCKHLKKSFKAFLTSEN